MLCVEALLDFLYCVADGSVTSDMFLVDIELRILEGVCSCPQLDYLISLAQVLEERSWDLFGY